jgi:hypothetical protein
MQGGTDREAPLPGRAPAHRRQPSPRPTTSASARERARPSTDRYQQRKSRFGRCLTVYGRKTVLEALQAEGVVCERLHLAKSNKPAPLLDEIEALARAQGSQVVLHERTELARISRHSREDQGVAADVRTPGYRQLAELMPLAPAAHAALLAVDGVTNPQNLGMLIRSAAAGGCGASCCRAVRCDICRVSQGERRDGVPRAAAALRQPARALAQLRCCGKIQHPRRPRTPQPVRSSRGRGAGLRAGRRDRESARRAQLADGTCASRC